MRKFVLGFIIGIFLTAGVYFYYSGDAKLRIDVGQVLDQDVICLENGDILNGWILSQNKDDVFIRTEQGAFTIPISACAEIKENIYMRYLRKLM